MRKFLLATAALGGITALTALGAGATPTVGPAGWHGGPSTSVVQADWNWNHRHWRHRRWWHHRWHYWN